MYRVPLAVDLTIENFSGSSITNFSSFIKNGIVEIQKSDPYDKVVVTCRPSFDVYEENDTGTEKGRGYIYWADNSAGYFVNDDTVYKNNYATTVGTISSGSSKVYFYPVGADLVLIDPENDEGWTIDSGNTLTQITDADFPSDLVDGLVNLNDYAYVLSSDGTISNSANGDATTWGALDYITAERDKDSGIYLTKHHDNIVALGSKTCEFFYDNANATGSPLARRQDIFHNVGCVSGAGVWETGNIILFPGTTPEGGVGVYKLENFGLTKVSPPGLDVFLTNYLTREEGYLIGSGIPGQAKALYFLTAYKLVSGVITPSYTFIFDTTTGFWYLAGTNLAELGDSVSIPIISWSFALGSDVRLGEGILSNGNLITVYDDFLPVDRQSGSIYVLGGYVDADYVEQAEEISVNQTLKIRTGHMDFGTTKYKYCNRLSIAGDYIEETAGSAPSADANQMIIRWSDSYSTDSSFDTYSPELIQNSARLFSDSNLWSYTTGDWIFADNTATCVPSGSNLIYGGFPVGVSSTGTLPNTPFHLFQSGRDYVITFTLSNVTAGNITARIGSSDSGTTRSSNGTYIETVACTSSTSTFTFVPDSDFDGSVSNLTIRETPTGRRINTYKKSKLTRCGRFSRRSFELEYTTAKPYRLEAIELALLSGTK
jgi:hypothetical protein